MRARLWQGFVLWLVTGFTLAGCGGSSGGGAGVPSDAVIFGAVQMPYVCEGAAFPFQLAFQGGTATVTGGDFNDVPVGSSGSYTDPSANVHAFTLDTGGAVGIVDGIFRTDPAGTHALVLIHKGDRINGNAVGVMQLSSPGYPAYALNDVLGTWSGKAIRVDNNLNITSTINSTMTISESEGLTIDGTDGDGTFSSGSPAADLSDATLGVWIGSNAVIWSPSGDGLYPILVLSPDKSTLAGAFVTTLCSPANSYYADMPSQKFALWTRQ